MDFPSCPHGPVIASQCPPVGPTADRFAPCRVSDNDLRRRNAPPARPTADASFTSHVLVLGDVGERRLKEAVRDKPWVDLQVLGPRLDDAKVTLGPPKRYKHVVVEQELFR